MSRTLAPKRILAVGDCNTLGADGLQGSSYPELVAQAAGAEVCNLGHTMATTREGLRKVQDTEGEWDCIFIQFGLVDSYKTFLYSPYVLYYPDNFVRKQARSLVKKYKKLCRKYGLNRRFGEVNVVAISEYERNIRQMIEMTAPAPTFLIDTVPNHQLERNDEIRRYNTVLDVLVKHYDNCCKVDLYDAFENNMHRFYLDPTHCNHHGYEYIAGTLLRLMEQWEG